MGRVRKVLTDLPPTPNGDFYNTSLGKLVITYLPVGEIGVHFSTGITVVLQI